jgi:hypothetical protein
VFSARGPPDDIPQIVYGSHGPPTHGFPHVPASVRPHQDFSSALFVTLAYEDLCSSLALDVTMSLSVPGQAVPPHLAPTMAQPRVIPPVAPQSSPLMQVYGNVPHIMPQGVVVPPPVAPAPAAPTPATCSVEPLKLCELKDPKAFIDNWDLIQYYLRILEISAGHRDDALVTNSTNLEASCLWEGQLCLAMKDGLLCYLFEKKAAFITAVALKCWQCYLSIAALIWSQMLSHPFYLFSTMSRERTSLSSSIALDSMELLWNFLAAKWL